VEKMYVLAPQGPATSWLLEYKDVKDALQKHVKPKYKKDLKTIVKELGQLHNSNF